MFPPLQPLAKKGNPPKQNMYFSHDTYIHPLLHCYAKKKWGLLPSLTQSGQHYNQEIMQCPEQQSSPAF